MGYREHPPPRAAGSWVACTWERRHDRETAVRVIPDGCVDIVWTQRAGTKLVGANTTAFLVSLPAGTCVVGARLRPGASAELLGVPGEAVRDARVPIEELWASEGARLAAALEEHPHPVGLLREAILALAARAKRPDPLVREAVLGLALPDAGVRELAGRLGVSERQLRRRVSAAVGYGPKRLARVLRLGRALQAARGGGDLARVALDAGYADQAHFANDCQALAGASASVVLAR